MTRHHRFRHLSLAAAVLALALVGYGSYRFITLASEQKELLATVVQLRATIAELQGNLSLTEYERDRLTYVLDETQQRAGALEETTEELSDKVGLFEKLGRLDPELLKKYSKVYFLNEHYAPAELAAIDSAYVNGEERTLEVHAQMWPYLRRLLDDAAQEELGLLVTSAYRSFKTQEALKQGYRITYGAGTANQFSADQGYSEHQLGTTVDFTTKKTRNLSSVFDTTPEYKWLAAHAHEYGFVLSYPKGNSYYIYEPWHWRFVGTALATKLHDEGKTLYEMNERDIDEYLVTIFD